MSSLPLLLLSTLLAPAPSGPIPNAVPARPVAEAGRAVAISADGTRIAAGYSGGCVAIFEAATGKRITELEPSLSTVPWKLDFAPDGKRLAGLDQAGELVLWELEEQGAKDDRPSSKGPFRALPPGGSIGGWPFGALIAWSPDGERLIVLDRRGHAGLWTAAGEQVRKWKSEAAPVGDPQAIWSSDGKLLLTVEGSIVQRRDGRTGEVHAGGEASSELRAPSPVVSMELHPRGRLLATGHADCRIKLWDIETGEFTGETNFVDPFFHEEEDEVADLAFAPSGDRLAFSTREGSYIVVIDTKTHEQVWRSEFLGAHFFEVMQICWSPDGVRLWFAFECGGGTLYSVEPKSGAKPEEHGDGLVPLFAGNLGVVFGGRDVHAIGLDGVRLW